jgi:benzoate/toluate 1,2-dioxygenase beta subunit
MTLHASQAQSTPSPSTYVTPDFYELLRADVIDFRQPGPSVDPLLHREVEAFLFREARLIDDDRLEDWLDLFTYDCVYWVPTDPDGGDPATTVAIAFDDRRRLEDRIAWLRTGHVYSQQPRSRTVHSITNVEAWAGGDEIRVRSLATIHEYRAGERRVLAARYGHVLRRPSATDDWAIARKAIFLNDADAGQRNLTFVL